MKKNKLSLFEGYGIELEYMIVNAESLAVLPIADKVLHAEGGSYEDVERGPMAWSNELVLHVLELKTNGPVSTLDDLPATFGAEIAHVNKLLEPMGGRLMPTAMHPWMDPHKEAKLWPHEHSAIYEAFNRIFDCRGHGWSNLQSVHINLPFGDDTEFGQLHAAIRLLLPILPAITASSPIMDGKINGTLDNRLNAYRNNSIRVPSVSGHVIPEAAYSRKEYEMNILARIYQDLSPHDPDGVLQHEWVNARGAIARFERSAIEIRLLDIQECPLADLSVAAALVSVLKVLVAQRWVPLDKQKTWPVQPLAAILRNTIVQGHEAVIEDEAYLRAFNFTSAKKCTTGELWQHLIEIIWPASASQAQPWREAMALILQQGPLSRRIVRAVGRDASRDHLKVVYRELCDCLAKGKLFKV